MLSELGKRIQEARERIGFTQEQLGKVARINPMAVSHFECGRRLPSCKNLAALAVSLRVSADWLLGIENSRKFVLGTWPRSQRISLRPGPEFGSNGEKKASKRG